MKDRSFIVPSHGEPMAKDLLENNGFKVVTFGSFFMCDWNASKDGRSHEILGWAKENGKTIGIRVRPVYPPEDHVIEAILLQ